ncbi:carbohydrate-binding protein, partial [Francisella sciaenopsi]|uniref:carbohydrate-binding protein n=1 Tax=Francisella sciaenopsi TaxID=3055034 RepID=UPI0038B3F061
NTDNTDNTSSSSDWNSTQVYTKGDTVTYNGESYTAKWWTQGETPNKDSKWGVWEYNGEAAQGQGTVSIVLPAKPDFVSTSTLADVQILKNGTKIAELNNAQWGSTTKLDVTVGDSANLTISVTAIDGAIGSASPASFTLAKGASQTVSVEYTKSSTTGEGSISINPQADVSGNPTTSYTLTDANGNVVSSGSLEINKAITLDNIPSSEDGIVYTLTVDSFVSNGYSYTPSETYSIGVYNYNTSNADVTFTKQAIPTENVAIAVSGLPDGKSTTLTLSNSSGDTKEVTINSNSTVSAEIPKDNTLWTVAVASLTGYKISTS